MTGPGKTVGERVIPFGPLGQHPFPIGAAARIRIAVVDGVQKPPSAEPFHRLGKDAMKRLSLGTRDSLQHSVRVFVDPYRRLPHRPIVYESVCTCEMTQTD